MREDRRKFIDMAFSRLNIMTRIIRPIPNHS
jgi:hypothetical protein